MTYIVTQKCIPCRDTSCAKVCPVESFHAGPNMLYINPETCISCDACIVECPVEAIFHIDDVPDEHRQDIKLNERQSQRLPLAKC